MFVATALVLAQSAETPLANDDSRYQYRAVTDIEFGELSVGAELYRPELKLIDVSQHKGFTPLIRLRSDFDAEMAESVNVIK